MYDLFTSYPKAEYGIVKLPEWEYVRDGLLRNLQVVKDYYRSSPTAVGSDHLLVQILQSLPVPWGMDVDSYYRNILPLALSSGQAYQLTSAIGYGKIHSGLFYGKGNQEVIVAIDERFDPAKATSNWMNLAPVTVVRHPFTDLRLNVPNGTPSQEEQGMVVLTVNIPMLAMQYRAWYLLEKKKLETGQSAVMKSEMEFVSMFVLPNMLDSHLDYALFNRIHQLKRRGKISHGRSRHPFMLTYYDKRVTQIQQRILQVIERSGYSFRSALAAVPAVTQPTMEQALVTPFVAPTRQVLWTMILARLPAILFLIATAKRGTKMRNQFEADQIAETLAQLRRTRVLESTLPMQISKDTLIIVDSIIRLLDSPQTD